MPIRSKRYEVLLTRGAERDLESIVDYIATYDGVENANHVLDRLTEAIDGLHQVPDRGSFPRELLALGIQEYRQVFFKPYRVIYRVISAKAFIYLIADGRRDMQSLLARQLLGASEP